ncbi:MAG: hypothetical protein JWQ66_1277, partial [Mucilaginibacter sp.]|nr:hypothetical protein [Mucilaginibacter sp.]
KFFLMFHNYRQIYFTTPVEVGAAGKTVLVILKDVPKGLNTITILDSLQRPCAERIFFAHYDQRTTINVSTDSSTYKTRQKVKLKLKLDANDTLKGMVSVACVQSNRIEIKKANDIESYVYLKRELENLPIREKYMGQNPQDKNYLENMLLIKGWRRYKWEEMMQISAKDTLKQINNLEYKGAVYQYEKELKKPAKLLVMADSTNIVIITGKTGEFKLNTSNLITSNSKKVYLLLEGNNKGYSVKVIDPFIPTNSLLLKDFQKEEFNSFSFSKFKSDSLFLAGFAHTINLKGVTIKAIKDDKFNNSYRFADLKNVCGDYVCRYNFLNCQVHPHESDNRPPIAGETYHQQYFGDIVYKGCAVVPNSSAIMKGINYSKEFYGSDYSQINPSQPEYLSTIYWKNLCLVNSKKEIELSFYTSDITGPFKIIVQGITANDVIYGEKEFNVQKP